MEMAIGANPATPFSPSSLKLSRPFSFSSCSSSHHVFYERSSTGFCSLGKKTQQWKMEPMYVNARLGSSSQGGVNLLERPTFDQSQFDPITRAEEGGDIGMVGDKKVLWNGDSYRVLLLDDKRHTALLVARVLPKVVPNVTPEDATRLYRESRDHGVAVVIVTVKEHAEFYADLMIRGGLRSAIEPDSNAA